MAQSALRALTQQLMQSGPAPAGMVPWQEAVRKVPQRKTEGQQLADMLGGVSLPMSGFPLAGDVTGLVADAAMYANYPEERTLGNYALSALGVLPFVPAASALRAGRQALDMSQAARMQRARDMGFDTERVFYHGTGKDFDAFDVGKTGSSTDSGWYGSGVYLTPDPDIAAAYAKNEYLGYGGGRIIPTHVRLKNPYTWTENDPIPKNKKESDAVREGLMMQGYDGVIVPDFLDPSKIEEIVVFDPANIRSVNAAFDPAKRGSANLMYGIGGMALTGGYAGQQREDERKK